MTKIKLDEMRFIICIKGVPLSEAEEVMKAIRQQLEEGTWPLMVSLSHWDSEIAVVPIEYRPCGCQDISLLPETGLDEGEREVLVGYCGSRGRARWPSVKKAKRDLND